MNKLLVLFCVIVLSQAVFGQATTYESKLVLDPFTFPSSALFIITGNVNGGNQSRDQISESNVDSSILGGERDLNLRVLFSEANLVLSTNANSGEFSASTPNGPNGNAILQLDGIDNSTAVNRQGLNNLPESNFLGLGATQFRYTAVSDHPTDVVLKVYQRQGGVDKICQRSNTVQGDNVVNTVIVDFTEFIVPGTGGTCDISFNKIGAVELSLVMKTAVDINIRDFELWGPVVTCHCFCPTYTCRIILDEDDDQYFYYRSSDFNPDNSVSNPTTDFSTVVVGTTRTATPTKGLTPTRTPIADSSTSGSPITVSNGSPSTIIIISGGNDSSSDASLITLAGVLIFLVAALF